MTNFLRKIQNEFIQYDLEIHNFTRVGGSYKAIFDAVIYFDYDYSKFKGRVTKQITVKQKETYKQAIQRTIDAIESRK